MQRVPAVSTHGPAAHRAPPAFENGTLDPELVGGRLTELRSKTAQLLARRDELTQSLANAPTAPAPAVLDRIADHITEIITSGDHTQSKALIETPGRTYQDRRTRPAHPHLPHPPTRKRERGRYRRRGTGPDGIGSCNDPLVELTDQRTNRAVLVDGPEILIRGVGARRR
ncbi:hypothetical protein [Nocardia sp. NPDC020380]|uniref:hypothetical protein n=1 Tax=Nocardia sp. NPDC020380 TaxID=3364309 RepID=UPI0037B81D40